MLGAVLALLERQRPLQQLLLILRLAEVAVGVAHVRQRDGVRAVLGAVLALLERQRPLQQLLLLLQLAEVAVGLVQLR